MVNLPPNCNFLDFMD